MQKEMQAEGAQRLHGVLLAFRAGLTSVSSTPLSIQTQVTGPTQPDAPTHFPGAEPPSPHAGKLPLICSLGGGQAFSGSWVQS